MNILIASSGTGGKNIAEIMRAVANPYRGKTPRNVTSLYVETNQDPLIDMRKKGAPVSELLLIGADEEKPGYLGGRGSFTNPQWAQLALQQHMDRVDAAMAPAEIVFVVVTDGKGTGRGTHRLLCERARQLGKWPIVVLAEPDPDHEVGDHAGVRADIQWLKENDYRLIHIVNGRVYDGDTPADIAFRDANIRLGLTLGELMALIAEGKMCDPSDLAAFFAGAGKIYVGRAEAEYATDLKIDGSADERALRIVRSQIEGLVDECLGFDLLDFEGPVNRGILVTTIPEGYPGRINGMLGQALKQGMAQRFKKAPTTPIPVRFQSKVGERWGVTVLLTDGEPDVAPLILPRTQPIDFESIRPDTSANVVYRLPSVRFEGTSTKPSGTTTPQSEPHVAESGTDAAVEDAAQSELTGMSPGQTEHEHVEKHVAGVLEALGLLPPEEVDGYRMTPEGVHTFLTFQPEPLKSDSSPATTTSAEPTTNEVTQPEPQPREAGRSVLQRLGATATGLLRRVGNGAWQSLFGKRQDPVPPTPTLVTPTVQIEEEKPGPPVLITRTPLAPSKSALHGRALTATKEGGGRVTLYPGEGVADEWDKLYNLPRPTDEQVQRFYELHSRLQQDHKVTLKVPVVYRGRTQSAALIQQGQT